MQQRCISSHTICGFVFSLYLHNAAAGRCCSGRSTMAPVSMEKIARLSRLTAILLKLQTQSYVAVGDLATHFEVSKRTIYRDIAALEAAGVPIATLENKGFSLVEGYNVPPVMFSEAEANALIVAEKFIARTEDASLIGEFNTAIDKIKSVLRTEAKRKSSFLAERIIIGKNWAEQRTSDYMTEIQAALTNQLPLEIDYIKEQATSCTQRIVEPFAIYHNTAEHWVLIAWCRLRNDFRSFRVDRITRLATLPQPFPPHKMSLEEYVEIQRKRHFEDGAT